MAVPIARQRHHVGSGKGGDQIGKDPTNRGKLGTKRHLLSDTNGIPLAVTLSGANRHDMKLFAATQRRNHTNVGADAHDRWAF